MKNGITINGVEYKIVRNNLIRLPFDTPCKKCALHRKCKNVNNAPCDIFSKKNYEVYFVKVIEK